MNDSSHERNLRASALAAVFFLVTTLVFTWPQVLHLETRITDIWDAKLVARILHWDYAQTLRNPFDLFHATFFHPARYALAFSENLYGIALFGFPLFAAGASPVLVYNSLLLLGMFLSALSAWALARYVTGDSAASAVAGLVYAFVPWRISQLPHLQFQWGAFLPLLLLFLLRHLDHGRRRDAVLFGAFFAWNAVANVHYGLFAGLLVTVVLVYELLVSEGAVRKRVLWSLVPLGAACLVVLPFYLPYRRAAQLYGLRRVDPEILVFSARPIDFLTAGIRNRLYAPLTQKWGKDEGDLFPGLVPLALGGIALLMRREKRGEQGFSGASEAVSLARRRAARAVDGLLFLTAALLLGALLWPGLELGPLKLRDPWRILVFLTAIVAARLALAFPKGARRRDLRDWLRHLSIGPRAGLFVLIGTIGAVLALGSHTPYYRLLVQSVGPLFRSIRAPARAIVLFHLGLAVLAAGGLALLRARRRSRASRALVTLTLILMIGFEYRAFPLGLHPIDPRPPTVYRWLQRVRVPGAVIEWPLGYPIDAEYVFGSTAHEKPLINGYSGFAPPHYLEIWDLLGERSWTSTTPWRTKPIPDEVWEKIGALGGSLLIWHPHFTEGLDRLRFFRALRRGVAAGRIQPLGIFPHGASRDLVFRLASAPRFEPRLPAGSAQEARRALEAAESEIAPPFGVIHAPKEGETVSPGLWCFGWALDDSGIAQVRYGTELGNVGLAQLGGKWPGLTEAFPDYPGSDRGGYGFPIPRVPPGRHRLRVTLFAQDGGTRLLERAIVVR